MDGRMTRKGTSMVFVWWLAVLALFALHVPGGARAQEPPHFLIESIRVEGVHREAARRIVGEESSLKMGRKGSLRPVGAQGKGGAA
jgi:hypothetical protein